jgi:hypothetical protein
LRQLLRLDHIKYTITFIRTKVDLTDEANKPSDTGETTGSQSLTPGSDSHIYLGSQKGVKPKHGTPEDGTPKDITKADGTTVAKLAEELGGSNEPGGFRRMLEEFLNSPEHHNGSYLHVRGDQKVISKV